MEVGHFHTKIRISDIFCLFGILVLASVLRDIRGNKLGQSCAKLRSS
jgi:hypothetical protein